jgi:trk system potassium uptake protein TrkH
MTHWIGGIGIIVLVIVIMPTLQIGGYHLFTLNLRSRKKFSRKSKRSGTLAAFYVALTVAETVLLTAGGMNLFDSVCQLSVPWQPEVFRPKTTASAAIRHTYICYLCCLCFFQEPIL